MKFKYSNYNIMVKNEACYVIYNSRTGYIISLDSANYKLFNNLNDIKDKASIESLLKYGFILPEEIDELSIIKSEHFNTINDPTELHLTIQTTNFCNFACPYCYENHTKVELGDKELSILQSFIKNKINEGVNKIGIHWFGGEPLLNLDCIIKFEIFLSNLKSELNKDIEINNSLTTNGYFLDKEVFNKINKYTAIKDIQLTLDGPEKIHNKTRILKNNSGTFDKLINNITEILKIPSDITLSLRTNLNLGNIEYVDQYLHTLQEEKILNNKRVNVNFQRTHNFDNKTELNGIYFPSSQYYASKLLDVYKLMRKYELPLPRYSPLAHVNCTFNAINTYLISPDLKLYQCSASEQNDKYEVGNIDENGKLNLSPAYYKIFERNIFEKEKCKECKMLPICLGGCTYLESCNQNECIPEKYIFKDILKLYEEEARSLANV